MVYTNNPYSYNYGYYPAVQTQYAQPMIYPQQQVVEQPQNLNVQSGQTTNAMDSYMIWVQGEAGAKSYPVARGTTLPLFDTEIFNYQDNMSGYSQMNGESFMRGHSNRMPMYGRYNHGSSYGRSSSYSRTSNKDEMLDRLQDVMDIAVDEKDRKAVSRLMEQMSQN